MLRRLLATLVPGMSALLLTACATAGGLQETEQTLVAEMRQLQDRQDSLRAELDRFRSALLDSLEARRGRELTGRGELDRRLSGVEEELGRIAALLGATQRQITRLGERMAGARAPGGSESGAGPAADSAAAGEDGSGATADSGEAAEAGPRELYQASLQQFRRGAYGTARSGLREFLSEYPEHELAPDAQYYVAESLARAGEQDEALEAHARVVELWPDSRRAASALYQSGLLELERGNTEDARVFFSRVANGYPDSPEASLARDQLEELEGGG